MAMNGYGMYDVPPEIAAEQERIARQQAIADAMLKSSMTPLATNQGPIHWTQVLAQGVNARQGRVDSDAAAASRRSLGQQYQTGLADEVKRIAAMRQGQTIAPDPQEIEQANDQGYAEPRPVSTGNQKAAIEAALLSQYPQVRQMGALEHKTFENEQTKANDREARLHERILVLDAAAQNQALARGEREARAAEALALRRELADAQRATQKAIADANNATRRDIAGDRRTGANRPPPGYRWTPEGDQEVIPGGPADVKAQALAQRQADGATDVDVALGTLRDAYGRLEKGGGITSTENGSVANAAAAVSSSGVGQAVGKLFGTQNQSARNDIAMARPALLAALMKATGMSAKQMDSNAELKLWLSTATDPTLDVESNRRALDNIEKKYLKAAGSAPKPPAPAADDPPPGAVRRK